MTWGLVARAYAAAAWDTLRYGAGVDSDTRGQTMAISVLKGLVGLVLFALLYLLLDPAVGDVHSAATNATSQSGQTGVDRQQTVWNNLPIAILLMFAFGTIVISVRLRNRV